MQTLSTIFKHYGPHVNPIDHMWTLSPTFKHYGPHVNPIDHTANAKVLKSQSIHDQSRFYTLWCWIGTKYIFWGVPETLLGVVSKYNAGVE